MSVRVHADGRSTSSGEGVLKLIAVNEKEKDENTKNWKDSHMLVFCVGIAVGAKVLREEVASQAVGIGSILPTQD